jgi:hypothetical protein
MLERRGSIFSRIKLCVKIENYFFQANGIAGFDGLNLNNYKRKQVQCAIAIYTQGSKFSNTVLMYFGFYFILFFPKGK